MERRQNVSNREVGACNPSPLNRWICVAREPSINREGSAEDSSLPRVIQSHGSGDWDPIPPVSKTRTTLAPKPPSVEVGTTKLTADMVEALVWSCLLPHCLPFPLLQLANQGILDTREEPTIPVMTVVLAESRRQRPWRHKKQQQGYGATPLTKTLNAGKLTIKYNQKQHR